jgi:putative Holliday junction resolvase
MERKGGVLAIDHGTKRVGFAVVDGMRIAAHALEAWRGAGGEDGLVRHVGALLSERDVSVLLIGLPLDMDGGEGPRAAAVRAFGTRLAAHFSKLELVYHDERLTTKAAEELLREMGIKPSERRELKDSFSALVILRDWIESGEPRR